MSCEVVAWESAASEGRGESLPGCVACMGLHGACAAVSVDSGALLHIPQLSDKRVYRSAQLEIHRPKAHIALPLSGNVNERADCGEYRYVGAYGT